MSSPFDRLLEDLDHGRRGIGRLLRRDPQAILGFLGLAMAALGVALIILAWSGAAHSKYVQQQLSYLVSGGLLGVALVLIGGFLYLGYLLVRHQRAVMLVLRAQAQSGSASTATNGSAPEPASRRRRTAKGTDDVLT
jgi:drug/metabolite transporter (DMT)-like permease